MRLAYFPLLHTVRPSQWGTSNMVAVELKPDFGPIYLPDEGYICQSNHKMRYLEKIIISLFYHIHDIYITWGVNSDKVYFFPKPMRKSKI